MANYANLKAAVNAAITTNGNNEITGAILNDILNSIISTIGGNYTLAGVVNPSTTISAPDANVFWIGGAGTYTQFGGQVTISQGEIGIFTYNGSYSSYTIDIASQLADIDNYPTIDSEKLVKSGGVWESSQISIERVGKTSCKYGLTVGNTKINTLSGYPLWYYKADNPVIVKLTYDKKATNGSSGKICIVDNESDIVNGTTISVLHDINTITTYTHTYALNAGQCLCVGGRGTDTISFIEMTAAPSSDAVKALYEFIGYYNYTGGIVPYSVRYTNQSVGSVVGDMQGSATYGTITIPVSEWDVFVITGHGGSGPRLWCWVNSAMEVISSSNENISESSLTIQAPASSAYLIVNVSLSYDYSIVCFKAQGILSKVNSSDRLTYRGIATPTTVPILDGDIFYIAYEQGTYTNMGNAIVEVGELHILQYVGGAWTDNLIAKTLPQIYAAVQPSSLFYPYKAYYERYVKELYTIIPSGNYYLKAYSTAIYFGRAGLLARAYIADIRDGEVVPLTVYTSDNTDYPVGMVIGYAVFSDIAMFGANSYTGSGPIIDWGVVSNKSYSPMVQAYLAVQGIEPEMPADMAQYPELDAPTDLWVVRGNQLRVYYRNLVKSSFKGYNIKCVSSVGNAYPEYYRLDADTVGDYNVTISIVGNDDSLIRSKTISVHVIAPMSAPSSAKKVLVCGASVIAPGNIAGELRRRLTMDTGDGTSQNPTGLNLANISFVGRKRGSVVDIAQEATGGWSWMDYATQGRAAYRFQVTGVNTLNINAQYSQGSLTLTIVEINVTDGVGNIRCTYSGSGTPSASGTLTKVSGSGDASIAYTSYDSEAYNPFWNPNKTGGAGLDFKAYADEYCGGSIDVFAMSCGYNGIFSGTIAATIENYVKPFIRQYHTDFPNGKFILMSQWLPSPTGGMGANYGASAGWNWLTTALKLWELARAYEALSKDTEFSAYVLYCDLMATFDIEHSYPATATAVNPRSTDTEMIGTNGVHPTVVGQYELSDSLYYVFNRITF